MEIGILQRKTYNLWKVLSNNPQSKSNFFLKKISKIWYYISLIHQNLFSPVALKEIYNLLIDMHILVDLPSIAGIEVLERQCGAIPLRFCHVEYGRVSFFSFDEVELYVHTRSHKYYKQDAYINICFIEIDFEKKMCNFRA